MNIIQSVISGALFLILMFISIKMDFTAVQNLLSNLHEIPYIELWPIMVSLTLALLKLILFYTIIKSSTRHIKVLWKQYIMFILLIISTLLLSPNALKLQVNKMQIHTIMEEEKNLIKQSFTDEWQLISNKNKQYKNLLKTEFEYENKMINEKFLTEINSFYEKLNMITSPENSATWGGVVIETRTQNAINEINAIKDRIASIKSDHKEKNESVFTQQKLELDLLEESAESDFIDLVTKEQSLIDKVTFHKVQQAEIKNLQNRVIVNLLQFITENFKSDLSYINLMMILCACFTLSIIFLQLNLMHYLNMLYKDVNKAVPT